MKVLFLCTGGNSCRSLMAEAILQQKDHSLEVFSAGFHPDDQTDPVAIKVMHEAGIDISMKHPKSHTEFEGKQVDYLITICDSTTENVTSVNIPHLHKIHLGFEDPRKASLKEEKLIEVYRDIRDEIRNELDYFYNRILSPNLESH